jgi:hypothetical protein
MAAALLFTMGWEFLAEREGFAAAYSIKRTYADFKELAVLTDLFCQ